MSGQGSTREGKGGWRDNNQEFHNPRAFPRDGLLQKLPPEDTLTPCAVPNACRRTAQPAHSPAPHLRLSGAERGTHVPLTHALIPSRRPHASVANTHVPQRSPTGFLGHTSHLMPHPEHTLSWTPAFVSRKHTGFLNLLRSSGDGRFVLGPLPPV